MGISLENVSYTYQAGTPFEGRALFDMTTTIKDGSYTAFIGHTGSGKSTIMQLLNGLYLPTSGHVQVDDTIITSQSKNKEIKPIRKKVGLVFQFPESQLFAETVLEDAAFGPQNFGVSKEEAEQRAVVLVTHLMDDVADYATAVNVMEKGHLVLSGAPKEVFQQVTLLREKQLGVPKITEFALQLQKKGYHFESLPITMEEFVEVLANG